jgi:hypothetical protein
LSTFDGGNFVQSALSSLYRIRADTSAHALFKKPGFAGHFASWQSGFSVKLGSRGDRSETNPLMIAESALAGSRIAMCWPGRPL